MNFRTPWDMFAGRMWQNNNRNSSSLGIYDARTPVVNTWTAVRRNDNIKSGESIPVPTLFGMSCSSERQKLTFLNKLDEADEGKKGISWVPMLRKEMNLNVKITQKSISFLHSPHCRSLFWLRSCKHQHNALGNHFNSCWKCYITRRCWQTSPDELREQCHQLYFYWKITHCK